MSLAPYASPRAAPEPLTFREARDRLSRTRRRLSRRAGRLRLAEPGRVQLGARLVRRRARGGGAWAKTALKVIGDRVETRTFADLAPRILASRQRPALAGGPARRPTPHDARRRPRTLGDDAGGDEARPRPDPGDADAWARRHRRPDRARPSQISGRAWVRRREIRGARRRRRADRNRRGSARAPLYDVLGGEVFEPDGPTKADDPMLLYFTSGTTARAKLVVHTHASYPIGHLSTMFGLGLTGDAHLNISSPGWAKHVVELFRALERRRGDPRAGERFEPRAALDALVAHKVTALLRAPDRVADAGPARLEAMEDRPARGQRRGRAGQSGDHRAGEARLGPLLARFLRADRDDHDDRQFARPAGRSGRWAGRCPAIAWRLIDADGLESDTRRFAVSLAPARCGSMSGDQNETAADADRGRRSQDRRRRLARRRPLHHLHRPGRRRVQVERISPSPFELESVLTSTPRSPRPPS